MRILPLLPIWMACGFWLIGCATGPVAPPAKSEVVTEAVAAKTERQTPEQKAAAALQGNFVSTLTFHPGAEHLARSAGAALRQAVRQARQHGDIETIDVAVWSDRRYPAEGESLPEDQVQLAARRGAGLEKTLRVADPEAAIRVHNMAQPPSSLAQLLRAPDASLKDRLSSLRRRRSLALVIIKLK